MNISGRPSLHPLIFYPVKISLFFLTALSIRQFILYPDGSFNTAGAVLFGLAAVIMIISFFNLGASLKMGLPDEPTDFKSGGLYRFSRNPIYISFILLMTASALILPQIFYKLWAAAVIIGHHFIILSEEKFLHGRFGSVWQAYRKKVRRYL